MPAKSPKPNRKNTASSSEAAPASPPELIVIAKPAALLATTPSGLESLAGASVASLNGLLQENDATMTPIFGLEERVEALMSLEGAPGAAGLPPLRNFYSVQVSAEKMDKLAEDLLENDLVLCAYIQPPLSPPVRMEPSVPDGGMAPPVSPDFTARQGYLDPAPGGVDARYAWTLTGGKGQGVRVIDVEGAWRFDHEDLLQNQGGVIGGFQSSDIGWRNHGTAVVGTFSGDENTFGVTGIAPLANVRAISIFDPPNGATANSARAITDAANALSPGDILLIELHAPGPRNNFQDRQDQLGYIAVEWWPANFAAIVYATSVRGVIVVEAAGNGAENLDDAIYNARPAGFPANWTNPFNLGNPQSGAIIVGAGAPPPGTHGRNHGADRSRLGFSNWGARVDVQGWGREVTTTGYGTLQGGADERVWYTDTFNGTSSASPVVVGAVACLQGALRGANKPLLTPATARNLLRTTGSPQQDEPTRPATQRIGNRPNLRQALTQLGVKGKEAKEIVKEKEAFKEIKDRTKEGKEIKETKEKETFKEVKDRTKEGKEIKEGKEKETFKEVKDRTKETKEKEAIKDVKEIDVKNLKDVRERVGPDDRWVRPTAAPESDLELRLGQVEAALTELVHFITGEQRPDLEASALAAEADLIALSLELQAQAEQAKAAKDSKDVEKLREA